MMELIKFFLTEKRDGESIEDTILRVIQENVSKYKPLIYNVLLEGFNVYKDFTGNDEYFEQRAKGKWGMFDSYVKAGFTREEAMQIMLNSKGLQGEVVGAINSITSGMAKAAV